MKAWVLADGKGVELRPLTVFTPKAMVPLLNRPCLEYTIELLKRHGITDITICLRYFPDQIRDWFGDGSGHGVTLHYWEEATSGDGLKGLLAEAGESLQETVLVIDGAALTDCDLTEALAHHRAKRAVATLIVTEAGVWDDEIQAGISPGGDITRMGRSIRRLDQERCAAATGILYLEPAAIFPLLPAETFSTPGELAFALFRSGVRLSGYACEGYWSGLHSLEEYRQAQFDMLDGAVAAEIRARELVPGIYVEGELRMDAAVKLEGPLLIGAGAHLQSGASIGAYSVLGRQALVSEGAWLAQTIVGENAFIGMHAEVSGSILGKNASIGDCAVLGESAVIGDGCRVGRTAAIKPGVVVWPYKEVAEGADVHTSLIHGNTRVRKWFGQEGITGVANVEITPEFVTRLAAAYACQLPAGSRIALSACEHPFAQLLKHGVMTSLCSAGIDTVDLGVGFAPLLRYGVKKLECAGGIHLHVQEKPGEKQVKIQFVGHDGLPISAELERRIAAAYTQETYVRSLRRLGQLQVEHSMLDVYAESLLQAVDREAIGGMQTRLLIESESRLLRDFLKQICAALGIETVMGTIAEGVQAQQADMAVRLPKNGEALELFTHTGERIPQESLASLQAMGEQPSGLTALPFQQDALSLLLSLLNELGRKQISLAEKITADCPWLSKPDRMRKM